MNLRHYLGLVHHAELSLAAAHREVAAAHGDEPDVDEDCRRFAGWCDRHVGLLQPSLERYGEEADDEPDDEPERLHSRVFTGTRTGSLGLLRDLHDLYLMAAECDITWTVVGQAAKGARDADLIDVVGRCEGETAIQLKWLRTRIKQAAPQALVVA